MLKSATKCNKLTNYPNFKALVVKAYLNLKIPENNKKSNKTTQKYLGEL